MKSNHYIVTCLQEVEKLDLSALERELREKWGWSAGRAQTPLFAEQLSAIEFDRVVHGDLPRAYVNHQRS